MNSTHRSDGSYAIFRKLARMAWLLEIGSVVLVGLPVLGSSTSAQAACDPKDLASAVVVSLQTTAVCEPVCEDKYRCYAAAILGGALTVVANREGQDKVDLFCDKAQGSANEVIGDVQEVLKYQFVQDQLGEVSGYLNQYANSAQQVMAIVKCACATERLNIKNQSSFGACANALLQDVGCGSINFSTGIIESCTPGGKIIQDFFDSSWGVLKSVGCGSAMTSWAFDCGGGGTAGPSITKCYAGYQTDIHGKCHPCQEEAHAITLKSGRCGCESAYTPGYVTKRNIPILLNCSCAPPYQQVGDRCLCPVNMTIKDGACAPCADYEKYVPFKDVNGAIQMPSCQPCELGYHQAKDDPTKCVPGWHCDPKVGEVPDPNTFGKKCLQCGVKQRVVTGMPIYTYRCEDCAKGQKASPDRARCEPQCPPGSITNTALGFVGLGKTPPACIKCAVGEHAVYDTPGSSLGKCVMMTGATQPFIKKNCAQEGANLVNDPHNPSRCLPCAAGKTPNDARDACIEKFGGMRPTPHANDAADLAIRRGNTWLNPQPEPPLPGRKCPADTKPDMRGRCMPVELPPLNVTPRQ